MRRLRYILLFLFFGHAVCAQKGVAIVRWPAGEGVSGKMVLNLDERKPLFAEIGVGARVVRDLDPSFLLREGKRDLVSQNGWNIFFDKVPSKPYRNFMVTMKGREVSVVRRGERTVVKAGTLEAGAFRGWLEITLYHGSGLMNIAAVMKTDVDSTAILYDAGLMGDGWDSVSYYSTDGVSRSEIISDSAAVAVKYRAVAGWQKAGGVAVFPAPHQYFYPLDEAFNLKFVWRSSRGIGIRQDPVGDHRYVPWFNAPPGSLQRLNFFCLLGGDLARVKEYTRGDRYAALKGYKTMCSHFHNEYISKHVLAGGVVEAEPSFVRVFKDMGVDMVHLAEFHGPGHPRGPDSLRFKELSALFGTCERLSDDTLLLMPGEEPNEFFGGHWLALFPKPVYWVMSHGTGKPFVSEEPSAGSAGRRLYRIGDSVEMLRLLEREHGLAWTAHPRTKGSTGYPDKYRRSEFFNSAQWLGGAWKALPADLSTDRLGIRALDLLDDMSNWGGRKRVLAECDLFTIEPYNEMYGHMNVNYLRMDRLPVFKNGWEAVLDTLRAGRFFSTTGEVLVPSFVIDWRGSVSFEVSWTFPLRFAEVVSGDGVKVYHERIRLDNTHSFGHRRFHFPANLQGRTWARLEVWDEAVNGAFTQTIFR